MSAYLPPMGTVPRWCFDPTNPWVEFVTRLGEQRLASETLRLTPTVIDLDEVPRRGEEPKRWHVLLVLHHLQLLTTPPEGGWERDREIRLAGAAYLASLWIEGLYYRTQEDARAMVVGAHDEEWWRRVMERERRMEEHLALMMDRSPYRMIFPQDP